MTNRNSLSEAVRISQNRYDHARRLKEKGAHIFGYTCIYPPVEILTALDLVPFRIFGDIHEAVTDGDLVLSSVVCPYLRSVLDLGIKGRYDFLDGFVGAHTCDVGAMSVHVWHDCVKDPDFVHFLDVPHTSHPPAVDFYRRQIIDLVTHLESWTGQKLKDDNLGKAVELHNRQRLLVRKLYDLRKQKPSPITGSTMLHVIVAISSMPVEESIEILEGILNEIEGSPGEGGHTSKRLMLWGSLVDDPYLFELIESSGAEIVIDDICTGTRAYWTDVPTGKDYFRELAGYGLNIRCPRTYKQTPDKDFRRNYHDDLEYRFGYLKNFIQDWEVAAVVLLNLKYCDSHGLEIPHVRHYITSLNIPSTVIEHDYTTGSTGQLKNRVEALLEML